MALINKKGGIEIKLNPKGKKRLDHIIKKAGQEAAKMGVHMNDWTQASGQAVAEHSKEAARRLSVLDTGRLIESIKVTSFYKTQAKVGPTVNYAIFPHEGLGSSRKYGRRPFMEIGAKDAEDTIQREGEMITRKIKNNIEPNF